MRELEDRVAIVTGAGRGIGSCIALTLAREGATVCLAARSGEQLESVCSEIESAGGRATCIPTDMADEEQVRDLVTGCVETYGRLDIVVNNAASGLFGPVSETTAEQWDQMMTVNARGPFLLCREAVPHLRKQESAWIVNISSVVGVKGYANQAAYGASKHALMGFTKALARELHEEASDIRVHAICPGGVATEMVTRSRPDLDTSALIAPQDVADVVLFLVKQDGSSVIDEIHMRRRGATPFA